MTLFEKLSTQLASGAEYRYKVNQDADKAKLNGMSDEFQAFLYPLLFEPEEAQETQSGDQG